MADAVNYILQGVLTTGTAASVGGLSGRQAAGKTGTSNVANGFGTPYAAFAGYTPSLVGYVSVFNPISPTVHDTMGGRPVATGWSTAAWPAPVRCSGRTRPPPPGT